MKYPPRSIYFGPLIGQFSDALQLGQQDAQNDVIEQFRK
jgi:hypothetical protein